MRLQLSLIQLVEFVNDEGTEETNALRIFEQKIVRYIYRPLKKENAWNKNKQGDKGHTARGRYCKIYKIPPTKMVWSC
jgi:hypothetical protein